MTYTEADQLKDRIVEEELLHLGRVREWMERAERAVGPCPVEPIRLGLLRGRLSRAIDTPDLDRVREEPNGSANQHGSSRYERWQQE
jgi:hypothetical protein